MFQRLFRTQAPDQGLTPQPPPDVHAEQDAEQAVEAVAALIQTLARALLSLGAPAHRIEGAMEMVAKRLGVRCQFYSTPTAVFAALGEGAAQHTYLIRANPGSFDLGRLTEVHAAVEQLGAGECNAQQCAEQVLYSMNRAPLYGSFATILAFLISSGCVASLFGGSLVDMAVAAGIGMMTGTLAVISERVPALGRIFEPTAAALAAVVAHLLATTVLPPGSSNPLLATIAGLIVLLPGMGFTVAMRELATAQLVSGGARLAGALAAFMLIGFGMALGTQSVSSLLGAAPTALEVSLPAWLPFALLPLLAVGLTLLFKAHTRDGIWIFLTACITVGLTAVGQSLNAPPLNAFLGALAVGMSGNLFSRYLKRPATTIHIPGLLLLVPGSVGVRSLAELAQQEVISGIQTAFVTVLVAVALAAGLLLSNILLKPRSDL
jgi:uncharacterized membrane protein YjjP (DUF1212 family)